jgi:sulfatase modifying factor 1
MRAWALTFGILAVACGHRTSPPEPEAGDVPAPVASASVPASSVAGSPEAGPGSPEAGPPGPCPDDMAFVQTRFCPDIERRCLDMEHEEKNHLEICHAFAHEQRCRVDERDLAACVDRYEYPNRKGGHPVWMLDWYQAQATCESKGKRLCTATEWTAACEGPDHTPFPYGWERDHDKCNMDSFYIDPRKPGPRAQFLFYSKDPAVAFPELSRMDQSVPSGSMETCKSGFGVYDLPGNVDEWVLNDGPPHEKSKWAGLKGGAWGHVRSQCRPETFSHEPEFTYYFVGFRCCRDAEGVPAGLAWAPSPQAVPPPVVEPHDFAPDPIVPVDAPGPSKTKYSRTGHRE